MREVKPEEMKKYFKESIDFIELISNKKEIVETDLIDKDIESISKGTMFQNNKTSKHFVYLFSEKDKKLLREILQRSVIDICHISEADSFQLQSLILRLNLKIDKSIFDFETKSLNPGQLVKIIKKAEKKYLNKIKNDSIKAAIEALEADNKEITVENIHNQNSKLEKADIERYLKRLEAVKRARENNSKVKKAEA